MSSPEVKVISQSTDVLGRFLEKSKPEVANNISIQEIDIPIKKELPPSFEDYSFLHFSDTHNTNPLENNLNLCQKIEQTHPDAVIISGDLTDKSDYDKSIEFIQQIAKLVGGYQKIFIVTGNHEYLQIPNGRESEIPKFLKSLKQLGCNVLCNEFVKIKHDDGAINILGVNDPTSYTYYNSIDSPDEIEPLEYVINDKRRQIPDDEIIILISHRPEKHKQYKKVHVVFSGHAHGGQIRIFNQGLMSPHQRLLPHYTKGVHQKENFVEIISPGLSNNTKIPRINNPGVIYFGKLKSTI